MNVAVNQLDQMTQQNAALVEQSAAAAESLRDQAGRLAEAIGSFRTGAEGGSAAQAGALALRARPAATATAVEGSALAATSGRAQPPARQSAGRSAFASGPAAAPLPKPQAHPSASAKALPAAAPAAAKAQASAPARSPAQPAPLAPKALPNRNSAKASPKAANNTEGEWESF